MKDDRNRLDNMLPVESRVRLQTGNCRLCTPSVVCSATRRLTLNSTNQSWETEHVLKRGSVSDPVAAGALGRTWLKGARVEHRPGDPIGHGIVRIVIHCERDDSHDDGKR